jgi:O-antigen/teichoic acid export membrane protein
LAPLAEAIHAPAAAPPGAVRRLLDHVRTPLHRDGYALVVNSAFTAATGLLYWIVAANAYAPHALGVNSALIASMMFLAGIASLNLTNVLVRFLPQAGARTARILAWSYAVTAVVAALAGAIFLIGVETWTPRLAFLHSHGGMQAWFVLSTVGWCVFSIQDGVLTALGRAVWVPAENAFFSLLKLGLLPLFAMVLPDYGIFVSWTLAMLMSVAVVNLLVFVRLARRLRPATRGEPFAPREASFRRYFAADYAGSIAWLASINLLPLVVTGVAGATTNAYFALAWAVAFPLYAVATNVGTALVLHGAASGASLGQLLRKAALQSAFVLVPAVIALVALAPLALSLFQHEYAHEGTTLLRLLALGALPNIVLALAVAVARVQRRLRASVVALGAQAALSLGLAVPMLHAFGVTGAGVAWLFSQVLVAAGLLVAARAGAFGDEVRGVVNVRLHAADTRSWLGEHASGARRRRARSTALARSVLSDAGLATSRPRPVRTDSDVVVLLDGRRPAPERVVKIAWSDAGARALAAHTAALAAVRAAPGLNGWTALVPEVVASGSVDGRRYVVESGLSGVDGRRFAGAPARERALAAIVRGVAPLYTATTVLDADSALVSALAGERIDSISRAAGERHRLALEDVRRELAGALEGKRLPAARGHGDLWLGNALLAPDGDELTGLLDWEASARVDLPATEIAHLVLSSRSLASGRELGQVARRLIEGRERLSPFERRLIAPYAGDDPLPDRVLLLLAWVQHCAMRLGQGDLHARERWLRRNVTPVLAAVRA